jgi:hypothetical protein
VTFVTRHRLAMPTAYDRRRHVLTKRDTRRTSSSAPVRRFFVTRRVCDVRYVTDEPARAIRSA